MNYSDNKPSKVTKKYQVTLPSRVREALDISPTDRVTFFVTEDKSVQIKKLSSLDDLMGSLKTGKKATDEEINEAAKEHVVDNYKKKWHL